MDFDKILENVGTFGRVQKLHYVIIGITSLTAAFYTLSYEFIGKSPSLHCKNRTEIRDPCSLNPPCEEFVFGDEFTSIVTEWNLICEYKNYAKYTQSILFVGFLIGNPILGALADMFGRKRTFIAGTAVLVVVQAISAFTTSYEQFLVTRFVTGFLVSNVANYVLVLEMSHKSVRVALSNIGSCIFGISIALLALTSYYIRDWRHLLHVGNIATLPFFFVCWLIPESPRWLASKGRITEAENTLLDIALKNGISVPRTMVSMKAAQSTSQKESSGENILHAFKTHELRRRLLILFLVWPVTCMTYYGLTLQANGLGGNMYVDVALSGLVEIPGVLFAVYTCERFGRKKTIVACFVLGSVACIGFLLAPGNTGSSGASYIQIALAMTGKMGIGMVFACIYTYTGELLPTVLRSTGIGSCSMMARVGGILAPLLTTLGDGVTYTTYGVTCLLSAVLLMSLPETMNRPMPETIEDVESSAIKKSSTVAVYTKLSQEENGLI